MLPYSDRDVDSVESVFRRLIKVLMTNILPINVLIVGLIERDKYVGLSEARNYEFSFDNFNLTLRYDLAKLSQELKNSIDDFHSDQEK